MVWNEPLDLEYWFVNVLSGTPEIFTFISFIFIASISAYFKMLNMISLLMFGLFIVIMYQSAYFEDIYLIVVLLGGLIMAYFLSKLTKN